MCKEMLIIEEGNHLIYPQKIIGRRETNGDEMNEGVHREGGVIRGAGHGEIAGNNGGVGYEEGEEGRG